MQDRIKSKRHRKLVLHKETVRLLSDHELTGIVGAAAVITSCVAPYCSCPDDPPVTTVPTLPPTTRPTFVG